jgi:hypothetical protein
MPEAFLLGSKFPLFPAEIVSSTTPATVRVRGISRATATTDLEKQSVLLRQLFLHCIGYRHAETEAQRVRCDI